MTLTEIIQDILPEAKQGEGAKRAKYYYKDWEICYGCQFIANRKTNKRYRFGGLESFKQCLEQIKKEA